MAIQVVKSDSAVDSTKQRRFPRIRLQIPIFLRGQDASGVDFVELTKTLDIVQLTIPTPAPASSGLVPNETPPITAKVLRQQSVGDLRLFGLEFLRGLE